MNNVLIISNPQDNHTKQVMRKIQELGADTFLFCPEKAGKDFTLAMAHFENEQDFTSTLLGTKTTKNLDGFFSVWFRRPRPIELGPSALSQEAAEFARDEWRAFLEAAYAIMKKSLWVSHPDRLRDAARKPVQLLLAQELGLTTPRTLITNDADKARDFSEKCLGKVICKPTGKGWAHSQDGKTIKYVLTNRVAPTDLTAKDELRIAPVTFQEEVQKAYEIRANVVGQEILAVKIDNQQSKISQLDWRRYDHGNTRYSAYLLPKQIAAKCLKLTQKLGLEFGAIDLIRRPDGEYVFLEINGNGQFLWAEELSGVGVSESLARLLSGTSPPLKLANLG